MFVPNLAQDIFDARESRFEAPVPTIGIELLDKMGGVELPWYELQIKRLGKGKQPKPNLAGIWAFLFTIKGMFLKSFKELSQTKLISSFRDEQTSTIRPRLFSYGEDLGRPFLLRAQKVGALIVKDRMIISDGYNGTPSGFENVCEDEDHYTKWYVLHAEANAILKVASSTQSCQGATLYITLSPCKECSKLIHQSGIKRVVYSTPYRDLSGVEFYKKPE